MRDDQTVPDPSADAAGGTSRVALRLFTAVALSPSWVDALRVVERQLESAAPGFGRWVDPGLLHVTLVFLGAQPPAALPAIELAVREAVAAVAPIHLYPGSLGCFGAARAVRVVWAGVEDRPRGALARLRDGLVASLVRAGVQFDAVPFRPHITLARARRGATASQSEAMRGALASRRWPAVPPPFVCESVSLVRSDLRPTGPAYTVLRDARFGVDGADTVVSAAE